MSDRKPLYTAEFSPERTLFEVTKEHLGIGGSYYRAEDDAIDLDPSSVKNNIYADQHPTNAEIASAHELSLLESARSALLNDQDAPTKTEMLEKLTAHLAGHSLTTEANSENDERIAKTMRSTGYPIWRALMQSLTLEKTLRDRNEDIATLEHPYLNTSLYFATTSLDEGTPQITKVRWFENWAGRASYTPTTNMDGIKFSERAFTRNMRKILSSHVRIDTFTAPDESAQTAGAASNLRLETDGFAVTVFNEIFPTKGAAYSLLSYSDGAWVAPYVSLPEDNVANVIDTDRRINRQPKIGKLTVKEAGSDIHGARYLHTLQQIIPDNLIAGVGLGTVTKRELMSSVSTMLPNDILRLSLAANGELIKIQ